MKISAVEYTNNNYCILWSDGIHSNNNTVIDRIFIKSFLKLDHGEWCKLKMKYNLKDNYIVFGAKENVEFFIENILNPAVVMKALTRKIII